MQPDNNQPLPNTQPQPPMNPMGPAPMPTMAPEPVSPVSSPVTPNIPVVEEVAPVVATSVEPTVAKKKNSLVIYIALGVVLLAIVAIITWYLLKK